MNEAYHYSDSKSSSYQQARPQESWSMREMPAMGSPLELLWEAPRSFFFTANKMQQNFHPGWLLSHGEFAAEDILETQASWLIRWRRATVRPQILNLPHRWRGLFRRTSRMKDGRRSWRERGHYLIESGFSLGNKDYSRSLSANSRHFQPVYTILFAR